MATEKRLIDANFLVNKMIPNCPIEEGGIPLGDFDKHQKILALYPTVDAVEVPCKMGNTVFGIKVYNHGRLIAKQGVVSQMFFGEDMRLCICVKGVCRGEWGVNVFASKEEAEAAIGERRTDNA